MSASQAGTARCSECGFSPSSADETVRLEPEHEADTGPRPAREAVTRALCSACGAAVPIERGAAEVTCPGCGRVYLILREPATPAPAAEESTSTAASARGTSDGPETVALGPEAAGAATPETPTIAAPPDFMRSDPTGLSWLRSHLEDRYEVLDFLGRGGMGAVYKARQKAPERLVALKVMLGGALASERARKRFEREAMAAGRLQHPAIVPVYEVGDVSGQPYYTMEFVEGTDLRTYVSENGLDRRAVCELMASVCRAVDFAHTRGVIHRDLKPGNIMVDREGRCRILDFGLARIAREEQGAEMSLLTVSGDVIGTPRYMSPEQATGKPGEVDGRTDVYSLGVILYELTVGMPPYNLEGLRGYRALEAIRTSEPLRPSLIHPWFPVDLEAILLKALEKEKQNRYRTALALAEDLEAFLADRPVGAQPATRTYLLKKFLWRNRRVIFPALAGAFMLLLVGGVLGGLYWGATLRTRELASRLEQKAGGLQNMAAYVLKQAEEGNWEQAYFNAWLAERSWPADPLVKGLTEAVHRSAVEHVARRARLVDEFIRAGDYVRARTAVEQLAALADKLPFPDVQEAARAKAASFPADCWRELREALELGRLYTRRAHLEALSRYLEHFPDGPHAAEARELLRRTQQAPVSYFLEKRLRAAERQMAQSRWEQAAAVLKDAAQAVQGAEAGDRERWLARFEELGRRLDAVIWPATVERVGPLLGPLQQEAFVKGLAFRCGARQCILAAACIDGLLRLWDCEKGALLDALRFPSGVRVVAFSPDGSLLAVGCEDGSVHIRNMSDGALRTWRSGHAQRLRSVAFTSDGARLLTASADAVKLWRVRDERPVELLSLSGARAPAVLVEGEGAVAATTGGDAPSGCAVRLWDAESGELRRSIPCDSRAVSLAVSPDGKLLAAGCMDNIVRLWDLRSGHLLCVLRAHQRNVEVVAFSPGGRILATTGDSTIKLWKLRGGVDRPELAAELRGHERWVQALAFSPDGRYLASGGNDKTVRIWGVLERARAASP